jgi:hypothetical protein
LAGAGLAARDERLADNQPRRLSCIEISGIAGSRC